MLDDLLELAPSVVTGEIHGTLQLRLNATARASLADFVRLMDAFHAANYSLAWKGRLGKGSGAIAEYTFVRMT